MLLIYNVKRIKLFTLFRWYVAVYMTWSSARNCSFGDFPSEAKLILSSEKLISEGFCFKYGIEDIYDQTVEYSKTKGMLKWKSCLFIFVQVWRKISIILSIEGPLDPKPSWNSSLACNRMKFLICFGYDITAQIKTQAQACCLEHLGRAGHFIWACKVQIYDHHHHYVW